MTPTPHIDPAIPITLGFTIGLLIGLTGIGGGSLMTPALVLLGIPPVTAIGTDLLYASLTRVAGVLAYKRTGKIRLDIAVRLTLGSLPAILLGGFLLRILPRDILGEALKILLGLVLVVTSTLALLDREIPLPVRPRKSHALLVGFLVGLTVQFTSVGAGVIVGFAMLHIARMDPREVVGTSLLYGLFLGLASYANYAFLGVVDYRLAGLLVAGTLPGVVLGVSLGGRVGARGLKRFLNIIILGVGLALLVGSFLGRI